MSKEHLRWVLDNLLTDFFRIPDSVHYQRASGAVDFAHLAGIITASEWSFLFKALDSAYVNFLLSA